MSESPRPRSQKVGAKRLDFEIEVEGGRGSLQLRPQTFFGWLRVERLELEIPNVRFPLDITRGMGQFQADRCRVLGATFAIDSEARGALIRGRSGLLAAAGFEALRIHPSGAGFDLSGQARVAERRADFAARIEVEVGARGVRLRVASFALLGFLRRPAPLIGHDLLCVLAGVGTAADADRDDTDADAALVRGLAEVELRPLEQFLWWVLPSAGWVLPNASATAIAGLELGAERAELRYQLSEAEAPARPAETPEAERLRTADAILLGGDLDGAVAAYRRELARKPAEARPLTARALAILSARDSTLRDAGELARQALRDWPDFLPAHLTLGALAAARDRSSEAAEHHGRVFELAAAQGQDELAATAALAAARALAKLDAGRATTYYEHVLGRRPGDPEASEALSRGYAAERRWPELVNLLEARLRTLAEPEARAAEHVRIAELCRTELGDLPRARSALAQAVALAPDVLTTWEALAQVLGSLADHDGAITALGRVAALRGQAHDLAGEAAAHARIAALEEAAGRTGEAQDRYRRALALSPGNLDMLDAAAALAAREGRLDEATETYGRLIDASPHDPRRRRAQRELARLWSERGDLERARTYLAGAARDGDPDSLVALAELEEQAGRGEAASEALGRASARLDGEPAAALELRRGELLSSLGRTTEAAEARERAFAQAPGTPLALQAARALATAARVRADAAAEARWLDVLLAPEPPAADRGDLAFRRAELHLADQQLEAAAGLLDEAVRTGSRAREAKRLYADVLGALGDARGRARMLERMAAETAEDEPTERGRLLIASVYAWAAAGERDAALAAAEAAAALLPDDPLAQLARGEAAFHARRWDDVVTIYRAAIPGTTGAQWTELTRRLGVGLERQGRTEDALATFRAAVEQPASEGAPLAGAWRRLGELSERMGDYTRAAEAFAAAAADLRSSEPALERASLHQRAAVLWHRRLGLAARAISELEAALAVQPGHLPSLDALEALHAEAGAQAEVAAVLWRKLDGAARNPDLERAVLARLGEIEGALGRPDAAREAHRRRLALEPSSPVALRYLAEDAQRRGDAAEAEQHWGALAHGPSDDEAAVAERAQAHLELAAIARAAGRSGDAARQLEAALALASPAQRSQLFASLAGEYQQAERWSDLAALTWRRAGFAEAAARAAFEDHAVRIWLDQAATPAAALTACQAGEPRRWDLVAECAAAADQPAARAEALIALARAATDPVVQGALLAEAAELHRVRLGDPQRARALYTEIVGAEGSGGLILSPSQQLSLARRVASPALGRSLAKRAADAASGDERVTALRLAADKAREAHNAPAEEEHLRGLWSQQAARPQDLGRIAELASAAGRTAEAADILAAALASLARSPDAGVAAIRRRLIHDLEVAATESEHWQALANGLLAAAALEPDPIPAAGILRGAADARLRLGDASGAAESLLRSQALAPADAATITALDPVLRQLGRFEELLVASQTYLDTQTGPQRARLYEVMARICTQDLRDPARAAAYLAQAAPAPPATRTSRTTAPRVAAALRPPATPVRPEPPPPDPALRRRIADMEHQLAITPLDHLREISDLRQHLGELLRDAGEPEAACNYLELVLAEDPLSRAALTPLAELYLAIGRWLAAAEMFGRLSHVVEDDGDRAELLFRMGEVYLMHLGDDERAWDAYLKAIDLDETHVATLRRLVDYYWSLADDVNLAEIAGQLEQEGALPGTEPRALARIAVSAGLDGNLARVSMLAALLGDRAADVLASALADAAAREGVAMDVLAGVARLCGEPPGPPLGHLRAFLRARGSLDRQAAVLAAKI